MRGTLYGSLASPYVRVTRIIRRLAGLEGAVAFEVANPMDTDYRARNPLSKVPALKIEDGPLLLETPMIAAAMADAGGLALFPKDQGARLAAQSDAGLMTGVLDLGVAYLMESRRPPSEQSPSWQERRLEGVREAYPLIESAAGRIGGAELCMADVIYGATLDWLSFRLGAHLPWQDHCPRAEAALNKLLQHTVFEDTDPRKA